MVGAYQIHEWSEKSKHRFHARHAFVKKGPRIWPDKPEKPLDYVYVIRYFLPERIDIIHSLLICLHDTMVCWVAVGLVD